MPPTRQCLAQAARLLKGLCCSQPLRWLRTKHASLKSLLMRSPHRWRRGRRLQGNGGPGQHVAAKAEAREGRERVR